MSNIYFLQSPILILLFSSFIPSFPFPLTFPSSSSFPPYFPYFGPIWPNLATLRPITLFLFFLILPFPPFFSFSPSPQGGGCNIYTPVYRQVAFLELRDTKIFSKLKLVNVMYRYMFVRNFSKTFLSIQQYHYSYTCLFCMIYVTRPITSLSFLSSFQ